MHMSPPCNLHRWVKKVWSYFFSYRSFFICIDRSAMLTINRPWPYIITMVDRNYCITLTTATCGKGCATHVEQTTDNWVRFMIVLVSHSSTPQKDIPSESIREYPPTKIPIKCYGANTKGRPEGPWPPHLGQGALDFGQESRFVRENYAVLSPLARRCAPHFSLGRPMYKFLDQPLWSLSEIPSDVIRGSIPSNLCVICTMQNIIHLPYLSITRRLQSLPLKKLASIIFFIGNSVLFFFFFLGQRALNFFSLFFPS